MDPEKMDATGRTLDGRKHTASLEHAAKFASWPTPTALSPATEDYNEAGDSCNLRKIRLLASWATPAQRDYKGATEHTYAERGGGKKGEALPAQVVFGPPVSGSPAETGKPGQSHGQLNPFFSLHLMGYPISWGMAGIRAYLALKRR
jgi:hypothetical protein